MKVEGDVSRGGDGGVGLLRHGGDPPLRLGPRGAPTQIQESCRKKILWAFINRDLTCEEEPELLFADHPRAASVDGVEESLGVVLQPHGQVGQLLSLAHQQPPHVEPLLPTQDNMEFSRGKYGRSSPLWSHWTAAAASRGRTGGREPSLRHFSI